MTAKTAKPEEITPPTPTYDYGTGRRKSAIAQVRIFEGTGKLLINDKEIPVIDATLMRVLELVGLVKKIDISAHVHGGGKVGQIDAIRHGLARALLEKDADLRATLKKAGYLTRDSREKEREKYGLRGARRAPQFAKR